MALKNSLLAAMAVLALSTFTGSASADHIVRFGFYSGFPTDDCERWGPNHIHCYGSPLNGYYRKPEDLPKAHDRMTCGEARDMLRDLGYRKIKTDDCVGRNYAFKAIKKGHHYLVKVNAFSGRMTSRPL